MTPLSYNRFVWDEGDIEFIKKPEEKALIKQDDIIIEEGKVKIVSGTFRFCEKEKANDKCIDWEEMCSFEHPGNPFNSVCFCDVLNDFLRIKKISNSEAYTRALISRQTFSKMLNPNNNPPGKELIFAVAIGMRLSVTELDRLLYSAGYICSKARPVDKIVYKFISAGNWDIDEINQTLFNAGLDPLGSRYRG